MTKRIGNVVIIEDQEKEVCELYGAYAELRPYGKNGERICYKCAIKDKETTEKKMDEFMFGTNKSLH
jgi:hypothetical protein